MTVGRRCFDGDNNYSAKFPLILSVILSTQMEDNNVNRHHSTLISHTYYTHPHPKQHISSIHRPIRTSHGELVGIEVVELSELMSTYVLVSLLLLLHGSTVSCRGNGGKLMTGITILICSCARVCVCVQVHKVSLRREV